MHEGSGNVSVSWTRWDETFVQVPVSLCLGIYFIARLRKGFYCERFVVLDD